MSVDAFRAAKFMSHSSSSQELSLVRWSCWRLLVSGQRFMDALVDGIVHSVQHIVNVIKVRLVKPQSISEEADSKYAWWSI